MRRTYHAQLPLTSTNPHPRAAELCVMSGALDANVGTLRRVQADLLRNNRKALEFLFFDLAACVTVDMVAPPK